MEYMRLKLSLPPSVNWLYAGKVRRYKADKYKEWIVTAKRELLTQTKYKIHDTEWLEVRYAYYMPIYNKNWTKKKIDVFNYEKALSDFLADNIQGFKDEHIKQGYVEKHDSEDRYVIIFVKELDAIKS